MDGAVDRERMLLGSIAFGVTYLLIATRRLRWLNIDRASGAIIGAVLAVAIGSISAEQAAAAVDQSTLVLLLAVMGMGAFPLIDGFFDRAAVRLLATAGSKAHLLAALVWGAGTLSAVITNDAVCVLAAPLVVQWIRRWNLPRLPFLLALATASNTGSVATLVGNPQNMLCANLGKLGFAPYLGHMLPVAVLSLAVNHAILALIFRRDLAGPPSSSSYRGRALHAQIGDDPRGPGRNGRRLHGRQPDDLHRPHRVCDSPHLASHRPAPRCGLASTGRSSSSSADCSSSVDGFVRSGAPGYVFGRVPLFVGPESLSAYARTAMYFLAGSNVVTNVPFILLVRDEMAKLPNVRLGWEMLAMASTFAGNLTLLGSVANIIVSEKAQEIGGLRFVEYAKAGFPIAVATTAVGTLWLTFMH